ncbi:class I SAM-dependent methyltransferase [Phormidium pseudopriestleyi FRX01]|uniref:Class I SAM-dependent methyltransferase n=1 Tax=Phormidium pseudopriestleyi FRX01 TaxID=1759528 RepID=A0ABS3FPY7_9CYAN|nr:class I SAM-dependent methyltransferase [Phormidium pseudopriestleyi]MBO0349188.1 class I SAM-dependent methyltransferase [Phormidium pseudopriestleyi FRX01]
MTKQDSELIGKIRQQFDTGPYPRTPLEQSPKKDYNVLFIHSLVTSFYLRDKQIIDTKNKIILDAGCGTGYKALALAEANPGAQIVCIDLSEESIKLAQKRLEYQGFQNVEFYPMKIEEVPTLGIQFDYINNDEVLYLFPEPATGLQILKSVLKPDGIIRSNLHSSLARTYWYRAQELCQMMGLMEENPRELEIEIVRDTMKALKNDVVLKAQTWKSQYENNEEWFLMNYLFQGDKGYTIPELFFSLKSADLEFISMVNWRRWELMDLFEDPENLPMFLGISLPELEVADKLHLFELLHPINRLLDFWCGHPNTAQAFVPVDEWTDSDWQEVNVHLHPQLRTQQVREDLVECITNHRPFEVSRYITRSIRSSIFIESSIGACLLPLWEGPQPVQALVNLWLQIRPLHPETLEPVSQAKAFEDIKEILSDLETFLYVLLEHLP